MENKSYQLRYLPIFETDLLSTVNYITNVLKNEDAAHRLVDDIESAILKRLENPLANLIVLQKGESIHIIGFM